MKTKLKRSVSILLSFIMLMGMFSTIPFTANAATTVTDTLTASGIGTTTSYSTWSNKSFSSDAKYAGNSTTGTGTNSGSIQMRTNNSNSGIVTTASGGKATKVSVVWSGGNQIDIYGKSTAYSAATDLYGDAKGTSLGSITRGTSTELSITGDYKYIGIRSNSGAVYLSSIEITWETESAQTYDVVWDLENDSPDVEETYNENAVPSYKGATPTKDPVNGQKYVFTGWSDEDNFYPEGTDLPPVTDDAIYYAQYTKAYDVMWLDSDETELDTETYKKNAVPSHEAPTKPSTPQYSYTFTGWKDSYTNEIYPVGTSLPAVTEDVIYIAQYLETTNTYTVTWKNGDTTITTDTVNYNGTPAYSCTAPTKTADAQYTYTFDGWISSVDGEKYNTGNFPSVTGDVTYTAHFSETLNTYTVTWYDEDGENVLETDSNVNYGATPRYDGEAPSKSETESFTYIFEGWISSVDGQVYNDGMFPPVAGNVSYTAKFRDKGKFEETDVLNRALTGINSGAGYSDWSGKTSNSDAVYAGKSAGGNDSIQLNYNTANKYGIVTTTSGGYATKITVTWDSHTSASNKLDVYGKNSAYSSEADLYSDSVKGDNLGSISYGSTKQEFNISGNYEYIGLCSHSGALYIKEIEITWATASSTPEYEVTWLDVDGAGIYQENVLAGRKPSYDIDTYGTPAKSEDADYTYRFNGWTLVGGDDTVYPNDDMPAIVDADVAYQAHFVPRSKHSQVDILTANDFTATSTTYKAFSDVKYNGVNGINSDAVYAGQSARDGGGNIQLRATSPSGIVTTTSGGRAAKVAVVWDDIANSGVKKLNIYGKDSAYDSSNWYSAPGEFLGSIEYGTSTELELNVPYEYIAMRSDDGTIYLSKVKITWDTTPPTPHTVTWIDGNNTLIYEETVEHNANPVYNLANYGTPVKDDDTSHYTFSGWTNGVNSYSSDAVLPQVKKDITYYATFDSTPIYNVEWNNWNGNNIETDSFYGDPISASFDSANPEKAETSYYSYTFLGWKDSSGNRYYSVNNIPEISGNETFTAIYSATPKFKSGRVVSTTDDSITYAVGGKYYYDDNGDKKTFANNATFAESGGGFTFGGATFSVASVTEGEFAHTAYVTGEGTEGNPFRFYPNYIYSNTSVEKIADCNSTDLSALHPGDGFKGKSKIRVGDAYIRFLQYEDQPDLECAHGTNGFMGISETQYGNRYSNSEALPYTFIMNSGNTLYYLGELNNALNFSEELALDTELGTVIPLFTVTWANWDGEVIRTNKVFQGLHPSYGNITGSTPTRPDGDDDRYTFSGWTDGNNNYGIDDELPAMTGDITYTATYTSAPLAEYTVTWNNYDDTFLATTTCKDGKIPSYPNNYPSKPSDNDYIYTFAGWNDGTKNHPVNNMPAVKGDITFTAYYTASPIPEAPATYTVTWVDWDDTVLETDYNVAEGATPSFDDYPPTRAADNDYTYTFRGWYPHVQTVTYNVTFKAQYIKTPKNPVGPIENIEWIFPTDDGMTYDLKDSNLYYLYNNEVLPLSSNDPALFDSDGEHITLGGKTVADIGVTLFEDSYYAEFINSVYVSGCGSEDDPFVFHPNYLYYGTKNKIESGCVVALKEEYKQGTVKAKTVSYPGDQYKGNTVVKVGYTEAQQTVKFLDYSENDELSVANYYIGVGTDTYGTHYMGSTAYIGSVDGTPNYFKAGNDTLYYHGEDSNKAFVFAEAEPTYQRSFYKRVDAVEADIFTDGNIEYFTDGTKYYKYVNNKYVEISLSETVITRWIDEKLEAESEPIANANPSLINDYYGGRLLGFQKKLTNSEDEEDKDDSIRFVTVLSSKILERLYSDSSYDFGYVFAAGKQTANVNINNLTLDNSKAKKQSCRDTYNTLSGDYGSKDFSSTAYKYITASVDDVPNNIKFVARFYITYKGETHYLTYKDESTGFVINTSEFF